ncbi:hypothetical protein CDD83_8765 [Cordyceps sp. RAO-2017]|nr:hypothetical protein CDD83_8765 [Cordyceps sp. RAO-2017]
MGGLDEEKTKKQESDGWKEREREEDEEDEEDEEGEGEEEEEKEEEEKAGLFAWPLALGPSVSRRVSRRLVRLPRASRDARLAANWTWPSAAEPDLPRRDAEEGHPCRVPLYIDASAYVCMYVRAPYGVGRARERREGDERDSAAVSPRRGSRLEASHTACMYVDARAIIRPSRRRRCARGMAPPPAGRRERRALTLGSSRRGGRLPSTGIPAVQATPTARAGPQSGVKAEAERRRLRDVSVSASLSLGSPQGPFQVLGRNKGARTRYKHSTAGTHHIPPYLPTYLGYIHPCLKTPSVHMSSEDGLETDEYLPPEYAPLLALHRPPVPAYVPAADDASPARLIHAPPPPEWLGPAMCPGRGNLAALLPVPGLLAPGPSPAPRETAAAKLVVRFRPSSRRPSPASSPASPWSGLGLWPQIPAGPLLRLCSGATTGPSHLIVARHKHATYWQLGQDAQPGLGSAPCARFRRRTRIGTFSTEVPQLNRSQANRFTTTFAIVVPSRAACLATVPASGRRTSPACVSH